MRSMNPVRFGIGLLLALFFISLSVWAQEPPATDNPANGQAPKKAGANSPIAPTDDAGEKDQPPPPLTPPAPIDTQLRVIGKATPYTGFDTPLRWGPFSIAGASAMGVEDWFNPGSGLPASQLALGLLQTNLDFDVMIHRSRLVLQYSPEAVIQNGHISGSSSSNNNLAFGLNFDITPRLTITVKDQFTYNQTKQVFSDQILQIYEGAGGILPGDFLQQNGSYLADMFSVAFGYKLSPRWTLTNQPLVQYIDLKNSQLNYLATGLNFQDNLALTYALSPRSNLSFGYNFQEGHTLTPTVTDSYYHGVNVFYARQISPSFWIRGIAGAEVAFYTANTTPPVFFSGGFSAVKNFGHSSFALTLAREKNIQNYLTNRLDDRVDMAYTIPITRRFVWRNDAGYYREIGAPPHTQGKYAQTSVDFHLTHSFISFADYTFRFQHAETLQLLTGTHHTVIFGLRWEPAPIIPR